MTFTIQHFIALLPLLITSATLVLREGLVAGILSYTFLRAVSGRWREVGLALWILSGLFILRFFLV